MAEKKLVRTTFLLPKALHKWAKMEAARREMFLNDFVIQTLKEKKEQRGARSRG